MANQIQRSARAALAAQSVNLNRRGAAFIRNFDRQEPRMEEIARDFDRIAAKVKEIIDIGDKVATVGKVTTVAGLGVAVLGLIAAPFTGGASAVAAAMVSAATAAVGGNVAINTKVKQFLLESRKAKDLERLGNEFMRIARPLLEELKEIKAMAQQVKVRVVNGYLMEKARRHEDALRLVDDTSGAITEAIDFMYRLIQMTQDLLQRISTDREEDELANLVVRSSEQCWKIINHFRDIKKDLQGFNANVGAICLALDVENI